MKLGILQIYYVLVILYSTPPIEGPPIETPATKKKKKLLSVPTRARPGLVDKKVKSLTRQSIFAERKGKKESTVDTVPRMRTFIRISLWLLADGVSCLLVTLPSCTLLHPPSRFPAVPASRLRRPGYTATGQLVCSRVARPLHFPFLDSSTTLPGLPPSLAGAGREEGSC